MEESETHSDPSAAKWGGELIDGMDAADWYEAMYMD